jgi:hypothetical protein
LCKKSNDSVFDGETQLERNSSKNTVDCKTAKNGNFRRNIIKAFRRFLKMNLYI